MDQPAPLASAPAARRGKHRRLWLAVGVLVALFILFEVGIRHVPPDGMTVTYTYSQLDPNCSNCVDSVFGTGRYTSPQDQPTIDSYYAAFNRAPVRPAWFFHHCTMYSDPVAVVFTWRGIPVESWTIQGCDYFESAGGVSDVLVAQHQLPDINMPIPPPN
ncbi:MAG TPA: hypothetical protein VFU60_00940 [Ktedonobacterales bacterium]|jgi:hypothetical protein|nr:hypothetical protein [Ktedonobacterales bacterium]